MKKNIFVLSLFLWAIISGNAFSQSQSFLLENGDFEQWEVPPGLDSTLMEPVDWSSLKTSDSDNLNSLAPSVMQPSTDAHSGKYSVYLFNVWNSFINTTVVGVLTNGRVHADITADKRYIYTDTSDAKWHSVIDSRPDSLTGWFKFYPIENDRGSVKVNLHTGYFRVPATQSDSANLVGYAIFQMPPDTVDRWTRFSVPFHYLQNINPGYYLVVLNAGDGTNARTGSKAWIDDLQFVYNDISASRKNPAKENLKVYASFGNIHIRMEKSTDSEYNLIITDILGRQIYRNRLPAQEELHINPGRPGIYIVRLYNGREVYTRKVMVR